MFWYLQKEGRFPEARSKFYVAEIILALEYLHQNDVIYRDLKPENLLLDADGHVVLCDFGLSKVNIESEKAQSIIGTTEYLAPEVLLDEYGYTKMVDFWSLGVLTFEMTCGWSPFYAEDTQQMYKNIAFGKVRFPRDALSSKGRDFVKRLLKRTPKNRIGADNGTQDLKEHAFFSDIAWDALQERRITPPFRPTLVKAEQPQATLNPEFTNALMDSSSLQAVAAALTSGFSGSTPLSPSMQQQFKGFTFVDESAMVQVFSELGMNNEQDIFQQDEERTTIDQTSAHIFPELRMNEEE